MPEYDRLIESSEWIDLEFVERERTPEWIIEMGIQLHLAGLSLSNTKQRLEKLGVQRSRTAIHNWVHNADLEPAPDTTPTEIAIDEKAINVDGSFEWLFAAIDTATN
jgi:Transposase and inactivated derivatives